MKTPSAASQRLALGALSGLAVLLLSGPVHAHEGDDSAPLPADSSTLVDAPAGAGTQVDGLDRAGNATQHSGVLESSWPRDGVTLWVPPREGRLTFHEPVQASTLTVNLRRSDDATSEELTRLTRGDGVTEILFRFASVRPGSFVIDWTVDATSGERLTGSVAFELEQPIEAVGGQNHRHGDSHLYKDSAGQFAPRLFFVLGAALVMAGVLRTTRRGRPAPSDRLAVRAGAVVLGATAAVVALVDAVNWVEEYHDYPLSAFAASPGLGVLLPMLGLALYAVVSAPTSRHIAVAAALSLALHAGLSHAVKSAAALQLFATFTASMILAALTWSTLIVMLLDAWRRRTVERPGSLRRLVALIAGVLLTSLLMLFLHAGTLTPQLAFRASLWFRLTAGALSLSATWLAVRMATSRIPLLRVLAAVPAGLVVVATALLLWMPPPAAGL
jgi:methionine-rich copper-binding protein CopC